MDRARIETRLPHSGGMVLIDRVVSWSREEIVCGAFSHRNARHPLRTASGLSVLAGIEYAGQAIALHASLTSVEPLAGGVLAVLRDVRWDPVDLSSIEDEVVITAKQLAANASAATYRFGLAAGGRELLAGTATVAFERMAE